jgi:glutathione S-transferase
MPEARAKPRTFSRFHYLYLDPPLRALIAQDNPKARDEKLVNEKLSELTTRFDQLEGMLADDGFACEASFTFADCALPQPYSLSSMFWHSLAPSHRLRAARS